MHSLYRFDTSRVFRTWVFCYLLVIPALSLANEVNDSMLDASSVGEIRNLFKNLDNQPEFLNADEAFQLRIENIDDRTLVAHFRIAAGYYLYRDKISFRQTDGAVKLREIDLPPGRLTRDDYFGEIEIYEEDVSILMSVHLIERSALQPAVIGLVASYQGCAKNGICYPPVKKSFSLMLGTGNDGLLGGSSNNEDSKSVTFFSTIGYLVTAFATGLLLSFTPCVLPLIPILSSVIAGQGKNTGNMRTGGLSIAYVLGTCATYTAIGVFAGATGEQLQAYFQNIWAIGFVSLVLVLMAFSMFGLYTIQMPRFLQSRLTVRGDRLTGGTIGMIFCLGALSSLVVGACVSPLIISIVSIAILQGDPVLGGALMLSVALGMGTILIGIGFGAGFLLPKVGPWMTSVLKLFGFMLLGVAVYLLNTIPGIPGLLLWSFLLVGAGCYFAVQSLRHVRGRSFNRITTLALLLWGIFSLVGALTGEQNILKTASLNWASWNKDTVPKDGAVHNLNFVSISDLNELDTLLADARVNNKPVLIDYYADWCTDCLRMEKTTFRDQRVLALLQRFVLLKVDVTDPKLPASRALKKRYNVFGPPAILFFDVDGNEQERHRLYGYRSADEFILSIQKL